MQIGSSGFGQVEKRKGLKIQLQDDFTWEVWQWDQDKLFLALLFPYTFDPLLPGFLHQQQRANQYSKQTVKRKISQQLGDW